MAKFFVLAGFLSTAMFIVYSFLSLALPWDPAGEWARASYNTIFGVTVRIAIASLVAYAVAEYQDVISFFFFRKWFGEGKFWLSSNLSNLWSQLLDSVLLMTIDFAREYQTQVLIHIIISWWLFKFAMGFVYTPLSYLGIRLLRGKTA